MDEIVIVENLQKTYGTDIIAVDGISFTVSFNTKRFIREQQQKKSGERRNGNKQFRSA